MGALSKGCGACKKKKVKCDETRPKCTRCRNAGIECSGFAQRLRFVDETPRIQRSVAISQTQSHEFSTITRNLRLNFHSSRVPRSRLYSHGSLLASTLPLTAYKDDIFISYLVSKWFEGEHRYPLNAGEHRCGLPIEWIPELVKTSRKPRHKSWDALAAIVFGQAHRSYDVTTDALRLYGQALSELRNQLSSPDDRRTDSTLASVTALGIYEILASKTEKGWMLHGNGLGWLLEWRGPWQQKSYAGKSIFLEHRIMLVAKAIISRQSTFLHNSIWKTVPWEDNPKFKSAIDYLVDIGTDIAEYLSQIQTHNRSKSSQVQEYCQLRTQVTASLEDLNSWWRQWEAEHVQPATEATPYHATDEPPFPTILEYDMPWTAFTVCTYDSMRILLLQLWHMLEQLPNSIQTTNRTVILDRPNKTVLLGITSDINGLAREILRSIEYCYGKSQRFINTFSFMFIHDVAYGCFDPGSREAIWITKHGWAEPAHSDGSEEANFLRRIVPLGQIKAGDVIEYGR